MFRPTHQIGLFRAKSNEAGAKLASPNFVNQIDFTIANNVTEVDAVDSLGPVGITGHECTITVNLNTFFGDNTLLGKLFAGQATALNMRAVKSGGAALSAGVNGQAQIIQFPRLTYNGGTLPNAGAKNQDVMLNLTTRASIDALTNAMILWDRLEYYEL